MIKNSLKIIGIVVLAVLQLAIISKFSIYGSAPNLILIIIVILILKNFVYDAFLLVLIGGTILDIGSPFKFGLLISTYLLISILVYFVVDRISIVTNYFVSLLIFLGAFLVFNFLISLFYTKSLNLSFVSDSLINSLWGLLILFAVQKYFRLEEKT